NKLTQVVSLDLELTPNLFEFDLSKNANDIEVFKHGEEYVLKNRNSGHVYTIPNSTISAPTSDFLSEIGALELSSDKIRHEKFMEYVSTLPNVIKLT
ncbi:hypothetical protein, partial [Providencia stuartii]